MIDEMKAERLKEARDRAIEGNRTLAKVCAVLGSIYLIGHILHTPAVWGGGSWSPVGGYQTVAAVLSVPAIAWSLGYLIFTRRSV